MKIVSIKRIRGIRRLWHIGERDVVVETETGIYKKFTVHVMGQFGDLNDESVMFFIRNKLLTGNEFIDADEPKQYQSLIGKEVKL